VLGMPAPPAQHGPAEAGAGRPEPESAGPRGV